MGWDNILMGFVDLMNSSDKSFKEFFVTRNEMVKVTGLSEAAVTNNLSVCVKNGWLKRVDINNGCGRESRYYINNDELISFVEKFLR